MSLTAFQRYRRLKQIDEMKPENIMKKNEAITEPAITPVQEVAAVKAEPTPRRRRRTSEE